MKHRRTEPARSALQILVECAEQTGDQFLAGDAGYVLRAVAAGRFADARRVIADQIFGELDREDLTIMKNYVTELPTQ